MAASICVSRETKEFLALRKPDGISWDAYLFRLAAPATDDVDPKDVRLALRRLRARDRAVALDEFNAKLGRRLRRPSPHRSR